MTIRRSGTTNTSRAVVARWACGVGAALLLLLAGVAIGRVTASPSPGLAPAAAAEFTPPKPDLMSAENSLYLSKLEEWAGRYDELNRHLVEWSTDPRRTSADREKVQGWGFNLSGTTLLLSTLGREIAEYPAPAAFTDIHADMLRVAVYTGEAGVFLNELYDDCAGGVSANYDTYLTSANQYIEKADTVMGEVSEKLQRLGR